MCDVLKHVVRSVEPSGKFKNWKLCRNENTIHFLSYFRFFESILWKSSFANSKCGQKATKRNESEFEVQDWDCLHFHQNDWFISASFPWSISPLFWHLQRSDVCVLDLQVFGRFGKTSFVTCLSSILFKTFFNRPTTTFSIRRMHLRWHCLVTSLCLSWLCNFFSQQFRIHMQRRSLRFHETLKEL